MVHHGHHHDASAKLESGEIPNVANETAAEQALNTPRAVEDENYVKGVYKSYIDNKRKQGENDEEVSKKLKYLQLRFPHFDKLADEVRENAGLPKTPN